MYNKVILVGNLTRDIELRYAQSGSAIAKTAIATSRKFTLNGEKKEETCFVDITFFGRSGEVANQYLHKGSKILVEGRLQFEQWVDKEGQKRSKHSVIVETMQMLDSRGDSGSQGNNSEYSNGGNSGYGSGYNNPTPKPMYNAQAPSYSQPAPSYSQPTPVRMPENNLPEIDINEDEIPF